MINKTNKKISIVMCTFNGDKYIKDQLNSFINQIRLPDELIICDDCSEDTTIEIIRDFINIAPFKIELIINKERKGVTKNFEQGIRLTTGDIIVLSDQDDVWDNRKLLEIEKRFIENDKLGLIFSDAEIVDESLNSLGYTLWESIGFIGEIKKRFKHESINVLLKKNVVTGATLAFNSLIVKEILPIPNNWIHDAWIAIIISTLDDYEIGYIDMQLIKYRQHGKNQIGAVKKNIIERYKVSKNRSINELEIQLEKIKELEQKCSGLSNTNIVNIISKKKEHVLFRKILPKNVFVRALKVFNKRKNYSMFSNGFKSIIRDIFLGT